MTRGKEAAAAARRREHDAIEIARRLRAKLAERTAELVEARRQLVRQEALVDELTRRRQQIIDNTGDEVQRLRDDNVALAADLAAVRATYLDARTKWARIAEAYLPRGADGVEALLAAANPDITVGTLVYDEAQAKIGRKYGHEAVRKIQRARGERGRP